MKIPDISLVTNIIIYMSNLVFLQINWHSQFFWIIMFNKFLCLIRGLVVYTLVIILKS